MFSLLDKVIWKSGLRGPIPPPARSTATGEFAYLHDMPRHQSATLVLDGQDFQVADGFSFYWMHKEIYDEEIYRFRPQSDQPLIIDCGANYGVSLTWFKKHYPFSRIIAVEADPCIYKILEANVKRHQLDNIQLMQRAVSATRAPLSFSCIGADSSRIQSLNPEAEYNGSSVVSIQSVLIDDLIDNEIVDFLKVDIEGAEVDALNACRKLDQVNQLFVEYHSFAHAPQKLQELLRTLQDAGFRYYIDKIYRPQRPYQEITSNQGMDLQLAIYATRPT